MGIFDKIFKFKKDEIVPTSIFIPHENTYKAYTGEILTNSIIGIAKNFGYNQDQIHSYFAFSNKSLKIQVIVFEIFSTNIIFILTGHPTTSINKGDVKAFMENFDFKKEYDIITVNEILKNGIHNKSLTLDFLSKVLNIPHPLHDGIFLVSKIDCYLYFSDNNLIDFQTSDIYNEAAKYFKTHTPNMFYKLENTSKKFWGNNEPIKVANEVNAQCDALFNLPEVMGNVYINLHTNDDGSVNFLMLLVCHYSQKITLSQFLELNYGRHDQLMNNSNEDEFVYSLNNFNYTFSNSGDLLKIVQKG